MQLNHLFTIRSSEKALKLKNHCQYHFELPKNFSQDVQKDLTENRLI